jgi:uncharacterized damage-inducible protein DinB
MARQSDAARGGTRVIEEIYAELELIQTRVLEGLAEIPDERLEWKPTRTSAAAAEITWHMASAERRLAARLRGEDADRIDAAAGTQGWIEAAARGEADVSAVPRDRSGLETALAAARRETLASLSSLTAAQLSEVTGEFAGQPRTRAFWARTIVRHHSYHAGQLFTLAALIRGGL